MRIVVKTNTLRQEHILDDKLHTGMSIGTHFRRPYLNSIITRSEWDLGGYTY